MKNGFEIENSDSGGGLSIFTKMIFYLKGLFLEFSWNSGRDQWCYHDAFYTDCFSSLGCKESH